MSEPMPQRQQIVALHLHTLRGTCTECEAHSICCSLRRSDRQWHGHGCLLFKCSFKLPSHPFKHVHHARHTSSANHTQPYLFYKRAGRSQIESTAVAGLVLHSGCLHCYRCCSAPLKSPHMPDVGPGQVLIVNPPTQTHSPLEMLKRCSSAHPVSVTFSTTGTSCAFTSDTPINKQQNSRNVLIGMCMPRYVLCVCQNAAVQCTDKDNERTERQLNRLPNQKHSSASFQFRGGLRQPCERSGWLVG